jgi:D-alanyl-D-alanine carboxypeptidase/D-alanyl-D-alanine-endopeptidase (penicillin-binding protein 4)
VKSQKLLSYVGLLILCTLSLVALPQDISYLIANSKLSQKDVSIYIKETGDRGRVVASLNAQKSRTPASVVKAMTTYAALLKLGFNYRWPTKLYTTGRIKAGILYGDLIIKGFGDPTLGSKDLSKFISAMRKEGIRGIRGNIVIDRSYFDVGSKNSAYFDENPYSAYNAMPDAMMFNERISTVCIEPKKRKVYRKHADKSYQVVNNLKHVNKPCKGRYAWPRVKISEQENRSTVQLSGELSNRCSTRNVCKVLTQPYKTLYYELKEKMRKAKMQVSGTLKLKQTPPQARHLYTHYAPPLEKIISKTAKKSNNLYARHLMLLLGAKVYGAPATLKKGRNAIKHILRSRGALGSGVLRIDNGSGLSRVSKMNALHLAQMYDNAYEYYGKRWMKTLSIGGKDGTIRRRFAGSVAQNRAWMKTGTLKHVKNIGGYVKDRGGRLYTVVVLVNSTRARYQGAKLQNDIIKWIAKGGATRALRGGRSKEASSLQNKEESKYYIQVGSFKLAPQAHYLGKLERLALPYEVRQSDDIYTVVVGPYQREERANEILKRIKHRLNRSAFIKKL